MLTFSDAAKSTFLNRLYHSWTWQRQKIHKRADLLFLKKCVDGSEIKKKYQN